MVNDFAGQELLCELRRRGTDEVIRITKDRVLIGSHRHCDVRIKSVTIAPVNCQIVFESGSWSVRNLADISQTKINGRDVTEAVLKSGDVLWIGSTHKYVVEFPASETNRHQESQTEEVQFPPCLMLRDGQRWREPIALQSRHTIGRGIHNSTPLTDDVKCSREHCEIVQDGDRWLIQDCGSRNGTRVNGELLKGSIELSNNDLISVGNSQLMFRVDRASGDETCFDFEDTDVY